MHATLPNSDYIGLLLIAQSLSYRTATSWSVTWTMMVFSIPQIIAFIRYPTLTECMFSLFVYIVFRLGRYSIWGWYTSPLRDLRFAPGGEGVLGHWMDMMRWVISPFTPPDYSTALRPSPSHILCITPLSPFTLSISCFYTEVSRKWSSGSNRIANVTL